MTRKTLTLSAAALLAASLLGACIPAPTTDGAPASSSQSSQGV